jgi:hypothetical protein
MLANGFPQNTQTHTMSHLWNPNELKLRANMALYKIRACCEFCGKQERVAPVCSQAGMQRIT